MSAPRSISAAIRLFVVPRIRDRGFIGYYPRLLRLREGAWDLVEFQISFRGGAFVVNLARFPSTGVVYDEELLTPEDVSIGYVSLGSRDRLGWNGETESPWFSYLKRDGSKDFEAAALAVLPLVESELESRFSRLKVRGETIQSA